VVLKKVNDKRMAKRSREGEEYGRECRSIAFGSDHAGVGLKKLLMEHCKSAHPAIQIQDFGTYSEEHRVDYPDIASAVCGQIQSGRFTSGVLLDGAGVASGIAANKLRGIRAAVVHDHFSVSMGRKHNDCNVICLGGKTIGIEAAKEILDVFITCKFEGERHLPRLRKLEALERHPECAVDSTAASPFKLPK
jgi:ribose 5-phosphate isomerase B